MSRLHERNGSEPPVPVRAVDFVMYCTKEMRGTRKFYQDIFGLERGHEWNDFWSEFATEPVALCLNGPSGADDEMRDWTGPACIAFAVDDVSAAGEACRARGVTILIEPVKTRVCWMAWIADPDGNRICLHTRHDGSTG